MSAYKELELAETERDEFEAREAIKWECREDAVEKRGAERGGMTPSKAIELLTEEKSCWIDLADNDDAYWTAQEYLDAYELVIEALEIADKYKWHDLREDPTDLPTRDGEYLIEFEFGNQIKYAVREYISRECAWGCSVVPIAWREIEPFEEAEE